MDDLIMIKSGALNDRESMPKLREKELGYRKDEKALYIGTESENVRLCGTDDAVKIKQLESDITELINGIKAIDENIKAINARLEALENPAESGGETVGQDY